MTTEEQSGLDKAIEQALQVELADSEHTVLYRGNYYVSL